MRVMQAGRSRAALLKWKWDSDGKF